MDSTPLSWDEEIFLQALVESNQGTEIEQSILSQLEGATEITGDLQNVILNHAPYSETLRNKFVEWLMERSTSESVENKPRHIKRPDFANTFLNFDNRKQSLELLLDKVSSRVLSIVGPSGVGKSRLVLETVGSNPEKWCEQSAWVNCRSVETSRQLLRKIACSLSDEPTDWLSFQEDDSARKESAIVVLDEFDPNSPYAEALQTLLDGLPNLRIIAISHFPIVAISAEQLSLSELSGDEGETTVFELFAETVQSIRSDIADFGKVFDPIRRLGFRLAGLPLGISLAAGCFASASRSEIEGLVSTIAGQTNQESVSASQRLDHLIQHILQRLTPNEYEALSSLSLFKGGFSESQADSISDLGDQKWLKSLVLAGLVQPTESGSGAHYEVPESVRNQLSNVSITAQTRYVNYMVGVGDNIHILSQHGEWKLALLNLLDNMQNLLEAARIAQLLGDDQSVFNIFNSVGRFSFDATLIPEFERLASLVRQSENLDIEQQVKLLGLEGANASMHHSQDECERLWTLRLELSRQLGDPTYIVDTLSDLATLAFELRQFEKSIQITLETESLATHIGSVEMIASALATKAMSQLELGNLAEGESSLRRIVDLLPFCQNPDLTPYVYQASVRGFDKLGEYETGKKILVALLAQASYLERSVLTGWALVQLGHRYLANEELPLAGKCYVAARKVYRFTSSKHYQRAIGHLARFQQEAGDQHVVDIENEGADVLIQQILAAEA